MIGVDTNVLVRLFAEDDVDQTDLAEDLFKRQASRGEPIWIGLVVLVEVVWVLTSRYRVTREEISGVIDELLTDPRVSFQDAHAVAAAAHDFTESGEDFVDVLITAVHALHGCRTTMTFDKRAARLPGMTLLQ